MDVVRKDIEAQGRCSHHWGWGHRTWAQIGKRLRAVVANSKHCMHGPACGRGQQRAGARWLMIVTALMYNPSMGLNATGKYPRDPRWAGANKSSKAGHWSKP